MPRKKANNVTVENTPAPAVQADIPKEPEILAPALPMQDSPANNNKASKADDNKAELNDDFMAKFSTGFIETPKVATVEEVRRGRPKGSTKKAPPIPPDQFRPQESKPLFVGALINGTMLLIVIDLFLPMIITGLNNKFNNKKVSMRDLKLPAEVRQELSVLSDQVIKSINLQLHPAWLLGISLVGAYSSAWYAATNKPDKK